MGEPAGQTDDYNSGERVGLGEQQMIRWHHNLLGVEPKLHGHLFQRIN
jgi:hypothetical protein